RLLLSIFEGSYDLSSLFAKKIVIGCLASGFDPRGRGLDGTCAACFRGMHGSLGRPFAKTENTRKKSHARGSSMRAQFIIASRSLVRLVGGGAGSSSSSRGYNSKGGVWMNGASSRSRTWYAHAIPSTYYDHAPRVRRLPTTAAIR